jgi:hypothetical protein
MLLQSIGGGGGNGGYGKAHGIFFSSGIGGAAGVGGAGGEINVASTDASGFQSATTGNQSHGLLLQSIGGGGYGGGAHAEAYAAGVDAPDVPPVTISLATSVGGNAGSGSEGGAINMVSALVVSTAGTGSHAIATQ